MDALPTCSGDSLGSGYYERATQAIDGLQLLGMHGERAALSVPKTRPKRRGCRVIGVSDKIALSDTIRKAAQTPCQTPQNQPLSPPFPTR